MELAIDTSTGFASIALSNEGEPDRIEVRLLIQPVQVNVVELAPVAGTAVFVDEREGGTAYRTGHAPAGGDALRQTGLAAAQFAAEQEHIACLCQFAQARPHPLRLLRAVGDKL